MNYFLFFLSLIALISLMPFYFLSLEHIKLKKKYGEKRGLKIAEILGLMSGWCFFLFLFGLWLSPQPHFLILVLDFNQKPFNLFYIPIQASHLIISTPIILLGAWFGIKGVKELTLKVAETHKPERVISSGIYSRIRHPQYFGAILSHIGISIFISSLYSLLSTPLIIFLIYIISWKEEKELLKEFGQIYENYRKSVPMLIPKLRKRKMNII